MDNKGEILIYQTEAGNTKIDVLLHQEDLWLTTNQLAELFQRDKSVISRHFKNIYEEGELQRNRTVANYATVQIEGGREVVRQIDYYNLDAVISLGYRVTSIVATHFRIWATERLKEYLIKGFVMNDERLKQARNGYFDELLDRIRDIRSSEKVFYRKVCDIYATSIDYDSNADLSTEFFATVQNKFHWAITGKTAAEIISQRANAELPGMGLTNFPGEKIKRQDTGIAKNYLKQDEIEELNLIVSQFLEFAELQARNRKPMHMADWMKKLHGFITLNDREILTHKGSISMKTAKETASKQFDAYKKQQAELPDELDKAVKRISANIKGEND